MPTSSTIDRFSGIARLYGNHALEKFTKSHVCVVGVGGVGSWTVEALARSGIGSITMIDLDEICVSNINRQLHAMDGQVGKQKSDAMTERIKAINPECKIDCKYTFYSSKNADQLLSPEFDYVIDAIDRVRAKTHLVASCKERGLPIVVCGGAGGLNDPTKIKVDDMSRVHNDGLLKQVRTDLRKHHRFPKGEQKKIKKFGVECIFSSEVPVYPTCDGGTTPHKDDAEGGRLNCASGLGSVTHMTATIGLLAAQRCLTHLANES